MKNDPWRVILEFYLQTVPSHSAGSILTFDFGHHPPRAFRPHLRGWVGVKQ